MGRKPTNGVTMSMTKEQRDELDAFRDAIGFTTKKPAVLAAVRFAHKALRDGTFVLPSDESSGS